MARPSTFRGHFTAVTVLAIILLFVGHPRQGSTQGSYRLSGRVQNENQSSVARVPVCLFSSGRCERIAVTNLFGVFVFDGLEGNTTYYVKVNVDDRDQPYFFRPRVNPTSNIAATLVSRIYVGSSDVGNVLFTKQFIPEARSGFFPAMPAYDPDFFGYTFADVGCYEDGDVFHPGLDYNSCSGGCETHPPIYAVADGVVVDVRGSDTSWGGVVVKHWYRGHAYYSQYGHIETDLDRDPENGIQSVRIGQQVQGGATVVGSEDEYGAGSVHLHLEIRNQSHPQPYNRNYWNRSAIGAQRERNRNHVLEWYMEPEAFIDSSGAYGAPVKLVVDDDELWIPFARGSSRTRWFFPRSANDEFRDEPVRCSYLGHSYGGHMRYLWTRRRGPRSCGIWRFVVPETDDYDIDAYVPELHHSSQQATYILDGRSRRVVNQSNFEREWVRMFSNRRLRAGAHRVALCNDTGESSKQVAFDAIKVVPHLEPPTPPRPDARLTPIGAVQLNPVSTAGGFGPEYRFVVNYVSGETSLVGFVWELEHHQDLAPDDEFLHVLVKRISGPAGSPNHIEGQDCEQDSGFESYSPCYWQEDGGGDAFIDNGQVVDLGDLAPPFDAQLDGARFVIGVFQTPSTGDQPGVYEFEVQQIYSVDVVTGHQTVLWEKP